MTLRSSWRRRSRAFRIATVTLAVFALAILLLWISRAALTEWAIESSIDRLGLGPSDVRVTDLGLARADMRLVASAAGTIDRIHVEYGIGDLLSGEVRRMTVDGARFRFAWQDGKLVPALTPSDGPVSLPLENLELKNSTLTLYVDGEEIVADVVGTVTGTNVDRTAELSRELVFMEDGEVRPMPREKWPDDQSWIGADLIINPRGRAGHITGHIVGRMYPNGDLRGHVEVGSGGITVGTVSAKGLSGDIWVSTIESRLNHLAVRLKFSQITSRDLPLGPGSLDIKMPPQGALYVALQSKPVSFSLQADGAVPEAGVPFTMEGTADGGFVSALTGAKEPATGSLHLRGTGTAPPAPSLQESLGSGLGDWLKSGKVNGGIEATLARLRLPEVADVDNAVVSLEVALADGSLAVTTPKGITVSGMMLDPSIAAKDSLFAGNSNLSIAPAPGAPFLAITPQDGADKLTVSGGISYETQALFVRGDIAGDASLDPSQWLASARGVPATGDLTLKAGLALKLPEGRSLPSAELTLAGKYDVGPQTMRLTADSGGLTMRNAHWGESVSLPGTSSLVLRPGASYALDRATGAVAASAVLRPFAWTAALKREGAEPGKATIGAARMALTMDKDGLQAVLDKGRVELPDSGLAARGISATISRTSEATSIKAAIADLRGTGELALFSTMKASADARIAGSKATFSAVLTGAGKILNLTAKGAHDLGSGKGNANVVLKPIDLSGDGTLKALSPKLAAGVTRTGGTVSSDGAIHWGDGAPPGTLTLTLKDVSVTGESLNVSALNGGLRLDSLSPIRSAGGQRLTGTLQLPTVNAVPFDVTFRLDPGKLVLERATAKVFDGQFETENAEIDAETGDGRVDLKVSDINIETAFAVLDLEQLKGTGRIGGMLPLRLEGGKVSVEKGHLESTVPGTLQVGVEKLADQLRTYGENVDMAFRALTDFHYDRMVIDADKPFSGAGKAMFRLEGNNPKVMEGQPFVFNISLETDFDYLTKLLLELSGAANTALGWGAQELGKK